MALPAMAFADGGVVRSPTLGLVGEYPGARTNPEIIAPQNLLTDIIHQENNTGEIIQAVREATLAAPNRIVEAIQNQDTSVHLDGKQLMQTVERQQRQRGADIMPSIL